MVEPFTFGIPLIARDAAASWPVVQALLDLTLVSALSQTDRDFRIIIAGHDEPAVPLDSRITFIAADWCAEAVRSDNLDSGRKKHAIAQRVLAEGGGLLMFLDGDDWVDRHTVETARAMIGPEALGGFIADGFVVDLQRQRAARLPHPGLFKGEFQRLCGSSIVARLMPEAADPLWRNPHEVLHEHYRWPETARERGAKAVCLPLIGSYVINTSANHSEVHGPFSTWRRQLSRKIGDLGAPIEKRVLSRFGLRVEQVAKIAEAVAHCLL